MGRGRPKGSKNKLIPLSKESEEKVKKGLQEAKEGKFISEKEMISEKLLEERKEDNKKEEINPNLKRVVNDLSKTFGKNMIHFASEEKERERIPTGIKEIDSLIGGGIISGSFQILYGNSGVGKTTISYYLIANAQKSGKTCIYFDLEGSFNSSYAKQLGVDLDKLLVAHVKTAEECMDTLIKLSEEKVINFAIIDSVQAMSPTGEQTEKSGKERSIVEEEMALLARKLSKFFRISGSKIYQNNVAVLLICQIRTDLSSFIKLDTMPSGHAIRHWSSLTLKLYRAGKVDSPRYKFEIKGKKKEIIIGYSLIIKLEKTKISQTAPEGTEANTNFYYGFGFNKPSEEMIKKEYSEWIDFEESTE